MATIITPEGLTLHDVVGSQGTEQWYAGFEVTCAPMPMNAVIEYPVAFFRHADPTAGIDIIPTNYLIIDYSARDVTQLLVSLWDAKGFLIPPLIIQGNVWHEKMLTRIVQRDMAGFNIRIQSNGTGHFEFQALGFTTP